MVDNKNFIQSLSNILQIKIVLPKDKETSALGAAYLAALSCGLLKDTTSIEKLWKSNAVIKPKVKKSYALICVLPKLNLEIFRDSLPHRGI